MNKKHNFSLMFAGVLLSFILMACLAQASPIIYPAQGQDQARQNTDMGECHQWAVQNTGVDPAQLAAETSSGEAYRRQHTAFGGAAKGSLLGLAIGAIAGDAGEGAAIGAVTGGFTGGLKGRQDLEMQHRVTAAVHADQRALLQQYDRAYAACLTGRGYTVN